MTTDAPGRPDPDGLACQLTNVLVALECLVLAAASVARDGTGPAALALAGLFGLLAVGLLLGAAAHRTIQVKRRLPAPVWTATVAAIHLALVMLGAVLVLRVRAAAPVGIVSVAAVSWLLPAAGSRILGLQKARARAFDVVLWHAILFQIAGIAVLGVGVAVRLATVGSMRGTEIGLAGGLVLVAVAAQVWLKRKGLGLLGLDYNSVFHLILGVALLVLFWGLR